MSGPTPSLSGAILLLVLIAAAITALLWEVFAFARKRTILSTARFVWRVIGLTLIIAVFFGMFAGLYLIHDRFLAIRYWAIFLPLTLIAVVLLVVMAIRDWRWLMSEQVQRKLELYHQLGEELRQLARGGEPKVGEEPRPSRGNASGDGSAP